MDQMPDRKSAQGRELGKAKAYLRMVTARVVAKSKQRGGPLTEDLLDLRRAAGNAMQRLNRAEARYLAAFGIKCVTCGETKLPDGNFHKNESRRNGYQKRCIVCAKARRGGAE